MADSVAGMFRVVPAAIVTVIAATLAAPALAQFETSSLLGTVRDQSGAPVPDAVVALTNTETGVSQTKPTDASGSFEFFTVRIGTYVVTAEKPGFSVALADNIQVTVGTRQRVDLTLQIGQLTERVEVTAATTRLETDTSQRGQVISGDQIRAMALNGREYSSLVLLSTGVRLSTLGTGGLTPREGSFNVNGLRSTFNNFLIDGVDNNAYGTSNRDYFLPASGEKPPLERHQFGGVFGGPIIVNRAFFFADYEGFRQTRGLAATSTIPTADQRQGVFTVPVRNPLTGDVYGPGTPVPMTAFARKVLTELPSPTNAQSGNNYVVLQQFENVTDKFGSKVDVTFAPGLTAFGRYGYRDVDIEDQPPIPLPSGGDGNGQTYVTNKQLAGGATYIPSSSSLLEVRFGWSRTRAGKNPLALGTASALDDYGIGGLPTDSRVAGGLLSQCTSSMCRTISA